MLDTQWTLNEPSFGLNAIIAWVQLLPVELFGSEGEETLGISTGRDTDIERLGFLPKKAPRVPRCGIGLTIALLLKFGALVMEAP